MEKAPAIVREPVAVLVVVVVVGLAVGVAVGMRLAALVQCVKYKDRTPPTQTQIELALEGSRHPLRPPPGGVLLFVGTGTVLAEVIVGLLDGQLSAQPAQVQQHQRHHRNPDRRVIRFDAGGVIGAGAAGSPGRGGGHGHAGVWCSQTPPKGGKCCLAGVTSEREGRGVD